MSDTYPDELEPFIAEQMKDPAFAAAWETREIRESIIGALLVRRRDLSLTQVDVANAMGVTQATVSEFECAELDPRLSTIVRYARAVCCVLDVSLTPMSVEESASDAAEGELPPLP